MVGSTALIASKVGMKELLVMTRHVSESLRSVASPCSRNKGERGTATAPILATAQYTSSCSRQLGRMVAILTQALLFKDHGQMVGTVARMSLQEPGDLHFHRGTPI